MDIRKIVDREQTKYNRVYKQNLEYGNRQDKAITDIRGNKKVRKVMKKTFSKIETVLDVGCGRGYYSRYLTETNPHLKLTGIDIAGKMIMQIDHKIDVITCSCHKTPFKERSFDMILHLDGLEHIPVELEERTLEEQYRISKRYIYHQISTNPVFQDRYWEEQGLGALHINIKTSQQWEKIFNRFVIKHRMKKVFFISYKNWVHVLLEKIQ